ncbi:DNA replication complex GINS protein PSF2 [Eremomyces bilateralis CBS 781.70]|uniref:DNA replication complex GINS protein PSF2 n=1 Tax=Eremomyces bilateralis CBS 781.70 TaxID=1392243 RepID=A0A6G1FX31_9PEZI|nr:DNA replication complex GINS protein PSF2 [Eremomyces bilateralis CBS 781.70]KAF1810179.1 DNA replication complex GINS protein PSF2 [Eremomyces bilateralis CBS 781.70]
MALPLPPGLTPAEVAFLCEMEMVTIVPRQRLDGLELLGGSIPPLQPPRRTDIPLWLALLLKRQNRANIVPPPWLLPASLANILDVETEMTEAFSSPPPLPPSAKGSEPISPPFQPSCTADASAHALPYHWLEVGEVLLDAASDDFEEPDLVRRLIRDIREVRLSKLRAGVEVLDAGGGVQMNGVGGLEVAEGRAFIGGVIDNLRKLGASKEQTRKEREAEEERNGYSGAGADDYDDDMEL